MTDSLYDIPNIMHDVVVFCTEMSVNISDLLASVSKFIPSLDNATVVQPVQPSPPVEVQSAPPAVITTGDIPKKQERPTKKQEPTCGTLETIQRMHDDFDC